MSRKKLCSSVVLAGLILFLTARIGLGQDAASSAKSGTQSESAETKSRSPEIPVQAYRLDFSIIELEDGKKINSRQYSTYANTNDWGEIKIGTRVPVEPKEGEFQYLDVGTNISARVFENRGQTGLSVRAEISNFAIPEQGDKPGSHPVLRQLKIGGTTLLPLSEPIIIGRVDDPNSKRQFQLEVTVTKLK